MRHAEPVMGTVVSFDLRDADFLADTERSEGALRAAIEWLHWVDATFTTYSPGSVISRLGRGELTLAQCPAVVADVLDECERYAERTHGYFSARPFGSLDPSGYVKGWAVERAADLLRRAGSRHHLVNGGGDVQAVAPPGTPWRVGIAHPLQRGEIAAVVSGDSYAVATSGVAERGDHVVNPISGQFPRRLASVTLVGRSLTEVDTLATATFAMDDDARAFVESLQAEQPELGAFFVYRDGSTWVSPNAASRVTPLPA